MNHVHSELPVAPGTTRMPEHRLVISERGSFAFATCSCGWYSPARRSRDLARREGADHLAGNGAEPD
ncbi:hypothetical protein DR950_26440 [Kitasatospora xanthocidica]|uniref:Uncharacterized protein n=1 Tax=Kitasatospora xanthocidica TaxID=83382 RepID=A0A373A070_9ACTN|nr:hypothetical protein AMK13_39790 [Streptomyces sp. CB02056]RGD60835.1 hypothetical protein DR950_26440 [Kitasatospora xanthocidica]